MERLSICIPTWERFDLLFKSFVHVISMPEVDEIVIVDDASSYAIFNQIKEKASGFKKIKLFRNLTNQDCYANKMVAVSYALNPYVVLFDSDNILMPSYIDRLYDFKWDEDTILAPSAANPNFNYRAYAGLTVSKENVASYMDMPMFSTCLNTCNMFVNRDAYLSVWDGNVDPVTSDSLYFNYCWLRSGRKIHIVDRLEYFHLVHPLSHYQNNVHRTPNRFHETIELNLKTMQ